MLGDEVVAHLTRDGRPAEREAIRYVGFGGDKATAGDVNQRDVDHSTGGLPPEGKEGELEAAQRLIDWRNRRGEQWERAQLWDDIDATAKAREWRAPQHEGGFDCMARGPAGVLWIQVTRVVPDANFYRSLKRERSAGGSMTAAEAADLLTKAAHRKVSKAGPEITLLIDVSRTTAFALLAVVKEYHRRHGGVTYGFRDVWLAGPTTDFVYRLDLPL
jgi:hypothetical protein